MLCGSLEHSLRIIGFAAAPLRKLGRGMATCGLVDVAGSNGSRCRIWCLEVRVGVLADSEF